MKIFTTIFRISLLLVLLISIIAPASAQQKSKVVQAKSSEKKMTVNDRVKIMEKMGKYQNWLKEVREQRGQNRNRN